jgi:hypothetical protein
MKTFIRERILFLFSVVIFLAGNILGNTILRSGVEMYITGIFSGFMLVYAGENGIYPFAENRKLRSRIAFLFWIFFPIASLIMGGGYMMASYFENKWLMILSFSYILFGKKIAEILVPNFRVFWRNKSNERNGES